MCSLFLECISLSHCIYIARYISFGTKFRLAKNFSQCLARVKEKLNIYVFTLRTKYISFSLVRLDFKFVSCLYSRAGTVLVTKNEKHACHATSWIEQHYTVLQKYAHIGLNQTFSDRQPSTSLSLVSIKPNSTTTTTNFELKQSD